MVNSGFTRIDSRMMNKKQYKCHDCENKNKCNSYNFVKKALPRDRATLLQILEKNCTSSYKKKDKGEES